MKAEQQRNFSPEAQSDQIATIIKRDNEMFEKWLRRTKRDRKTNGPRLDLDHNAARYLIPPRLFELAEDPSKVTVRLVTHQRKKLHLFVVEQKREPLTDMRYLDKIGNPPNSVDPLHYKFAMDLKNGYLQPNDFIFYRLHLSIQKDNDQDPYLCEDQYDDRTTMHGKGIGTAAHKRLYAAATQLGFRYVKTRNNIDNLSFFTDKLGKIPLIDLPDHLQAKLAHPLQPGIDGNYLQQTTVKVLYPEDLGH